MPQGDQLAQITELLWKEEHFVGEKNVLVFFENLAFEG